MPFDSFSTRSLCPESYDGALGYTVVFTAVFMLIWELARLTGSLDYLDQSSHERNVTDGLLAMCLFLCMLLIYCCCAHRHLMRDSARTLLLSSVTTQKEQPGAPLHSV